MFEVIGQVNQLLRLVVKIDAANSSRSRGDRAPLLCRCVDSKQMSLAFDSGAKVKRTSVFSPVEIGRDQVEIFSRELRSRAARTRGKPDLCVTVLAESSNKRDRLSIGRPARAVVAFGVIGDLRERASAGRDHPNVAVA